tara:strand:+ start:974 stop:1312 length:339 start_codon:yes stop_codon:yes gene_type:complete
MPYKQWVYHETKKPKIIDSDNFEAMKTEGWADSPAQFIQLEALGVDKNDTIKAQQALDMVTGITESLNKALNVNKLSKQELEVYAKEHFEVDIDRRKTIKELRKEVKALAEA